MERPRSTTARGAETMSDSPFVTVIEVAALLRVSRWTVLEWTRSVKPDAIPCYGSKPILFKVPEVLAWFERTQARKGAVRTETGSAARLSRPRRSILGRRRQRSPDTRSGGRKAGNAGAATVPAASSAGRALRVPSVGESAVNGGLNGQI